MTSHPSPRRLFLAMALATGLVLAPRAEARIHPPAHPTVGVRAVLAGDLWTAAFDFASHLLHSVWANAGASIDPLGNH